MRIAQYIWDPSITAEGLTEEVAHVWYADLDRLAKSSRWLSQNLSLEERNRADQFRVPKDRQHFSICRGLLRLILGQYLELRPSALRFSYGRWGKPSFISVSSNCRIEFNVSHSNGVALLVIARGHSVGVDLEHIRHLPDLETVAHCSLCDQEFAFLMSLPLAERDAAFFNIWTLKESYVKATGEGLSALKQVEVSLPLGGQPVFWRNRDADRQIEDCIAHWPEVPKEYASAIVFCRI
jgi:4'-phosphopantetheinyl transferase